MPEPSYRATDPSLGNFSTSIKQRTNVPDTLNKHSLSIENSEYQDPTQLFGGTTSNLSSAPQNSEYATVKDEETPGQSFGGTAGYITTPDIKSLPEVPKPGDRYSPIDESNRNISVLNRNTMFSVSDYERVMLANERKQLDDLSEKANVDLQSLIESKNFFNLSLSEIISKTVMVMVEIFVDMIKFFEEDKEGLTLSEKFTRFYMIFLKKDRILYFGVFLIFVSFLFMVVYLGS